MATTFLSRFQREKSDRDTNNKEKNNNKSGGFSLSLSRSSAALSHILNKSDANTKNINNNNNQSVARTEEEKKKTEETVRQPRRYIRSATAASVTQLLSEGCNNLWQRIRRNPSERPDKRQQQKVEEKSSKQQNW